MLVKYNLKKSHLEKTILRIFKINFNEPESIILVEVNNYSVWAFTHVEKILFLWNFLVSKS